MSYGQQYYAELKKLQSEVSEAFTRLNTLQSALDKEVSRIYHDIEKLETMDAEQSYIIMRDLKETLLHRRVVKDEVKRLQPIYNMLRSQTGQVDEQFARAMKTSFEIRRQLNTTASIDDVLASMGV
ncbi:hypothetical protein LC085_07645 [Bacillus tianshenii]|uniref:hypothetical protein n=1 Tax=Sutcliffiella tianshenii TaxID=1463404 RepID=UPI001CD1FD5A|nr:hypothetical protein [Bacillus tianshenii]MCA1319785.1 hypothetical protein [Bacillus tianshenii]